MEVVEEREDKKKENADWTGDQSFIWGIIGHLFYKLMSYWDPTSSSLVDRSLCFLDFSGIEVCFLSRVREWGVRKQETCQTDVSVTCWGESGCCGKVSLGTASGCVFFFLLPAVKTAFLIHSLSLVPPINPSISVLWLGTDLVWLHL